MLDNYGRPNRILIRPTIPLDIELDRMMEMGRATTKAGLLIDLLWLGVKAKKEGEKYGDNEQSMQGCNEVSKS